MSVDLRTRTHWVFDMDGTLTVAMHDFAAICTALGLPVGDPILETLAAMPRAQSRPLYDRLDAMEIELAREARAQPGARELLERLRDRGAHLGILTRNGEQIALETLAACGLLEFFEHDAIIGRESAAPKPEPDGVLALLSGWDAPAHQAVMVGDFSFDIEAGRRAGTATVYFDVNRSFAFSDAADVTVHRLSTLTALANG